MLSLLVPFPDPSGVTFIPCLKANTINPTNNAPQKMAMTGCIPAFSRQLASASSDNCRGVGSGCVMSVNGVG